MEIEKEIKKNTKEDILENITLGHEIGAGAPCLKCKDKCEGFDLHFWRKICRNCKCGLEDHDVQLESEEDKKVGKLFEDTKYTGLIAKLKRDGVPSYRGHQVTICIPSPTTSTATPFSAGTYIPGSSQTYTPSDQSSHAPHAGGTGAPGAGGHVSSGPGAGHTGVPGSGYPGVPGAGHPGVPGAGHPGVPGAGHAGVPGAGHAGVPGAGHAGVPGAGHAGVPGSGYTGVPGSGYMGVPGSGYAGVPGAGHACVPGAGHAGVPGAGHAGVPGAGHAGVPGAGHAGVPGSGYTGVPGAGHTGVPGSGYSGVPGSGYVGVPGSGYTSVLGAGHAGVPGAGHAGIPGAGHAGVPGAGNAGVPGSGYTGVPGAGHAGVPGAGYTGVPGTGYTGVPGAGHAGVPGAGHTGVSSSASPAKFPGAGTAVGATPIPVPAKTNVVKSITYEWAPPGINQSLTLRYMELLPPERRPIAGTSGADYRKKQMAKQLPEHDQDPERCHELTPAEVKLMQQYVRKYKDEALGIGDITLPEEIEKQAGISGDKGPQGPGAGAKPGAGTPGRPGADAVATMGRVGAPGAAGTSPSGHLGNYSCHRCQQPMKKGEPAVYAERSGYDKLWHPGCFVCCTCTELLVDMIYFWKKGQLYCGRHYGDSEKPRCAGCDELIFSNEYTQAEDLNWHLKHFCCFECDCVLAGETYVMENEKPVCKPCYMKNHAVCCKACQKPIEPEAQRVPYGEHHWHADPQCFRCSCCSKCLIGQRFMALQGMLLCSVECKKKIMAS